MIIDDVVIVIVDDSVVTTVFRKQMFPLKMSHKMLHNNKLVTRG